MTAAPMASNRKGRKGLVGAVIAVGAVLLASLVALALALSGMITIPGITQASGELVLEAVDAPGRDAFATGLAGPAAGTAPAPVAKPIVSAGAATVSGGSVGLYGGTNDNSRCDPAQLVSFLGANPGKAQAWVAALNADPNLFWGTGTLTVAEIPAYVATLTPLVLLTDTAVTNHGYVNGSPTAFQAVLQAGTAVLVDRFGVPRARCLCGNPLIPPTPIATTPTIVGTPWPGFSVTNIVIVQQTVVVNNIFVVVPYPNGGTPITVAAGNCVIGQPCPSPYTGGPAAPPATAAPTPVPTDSATPAPTPTPTATAGPVDPNSVPEVAPPTGAACSVPVNTDGGPNVPVEMTNNSNVPIDTWWMSQECVPSFWVRLLPGETIGGGTGYEGDVFLVTSGTPDVLAQWTAPGGSASFVYP